jgi:hypothetical protein
VIVWRRQTEGWRSEVIEGANGTIGLPEIGAELAMSSIYEETNLIETS